MSAEVSMPASEQPGTLLSQVYPQLRRMAARHMASNASGHTLQPTALVHEAWIRLSSRRRNPPWTNASHLLAAAEKTMLHILIDRARQRAALKRGGNWMRLPMEAAESVSMTADEKMLLVHEALDRLEKINPIQAEVITLKIFAGMTNTEIARKIGLTERTVYRYLSHAKAWLYDEIALQR